MWTTTPQLIYYRMKAWNRVRTPPRADNLSLRRYLTHWHTTLLQDHIDLQCSTPWEREGFSETDSTQYCNSKKHQNWEEAQLLAAPPMHQIQPNGSIKDYLRHADMNIEHKLNTNWRQVKEKHPEGWSKKKHRSERKLHYSKSVTLYFAFVNIVLEIHKQSQLSQNSKLRMHLKQELVLTQRVSQCKVETAFTISGPKLPHWLK